MEYKKSENIKLFLEEKLGVCRSKIIKIKRKRNIVKIIYGATIIISISMSTIVAAIPSLFGLPVLPMVIITSLSSIGVLSTAISTKFNLKNRKEELNNMILRLDKLQQKLNYVITCNGSLTEEDSIEIIKEFI